MNDHACVLIWGVHTRMGHTIIVPYAYWISHTHMGRPIRVWAKIRIWPGRTDQLITSQTAFFLLCGSAKTRLVIVELFCKPEAW